MTNAFYQNLYTSEGVQGIQQVIDHVPRKVTDAMNADLCAPYTNDERRRSGNNSFCALKLDMMKAYDRLECSYLRAIMEKLGFATSWIDTVMAMVSSVSFAVLFNGERLERFYPSRGIRQGDPISPYLFLIAAEGLSCLLKSSSQSSSLTGIRVAPTALAVNHLLFADDSL
nr:secreted RxLR effector protein 78-like [Aegilops tauschii subsp. strangulata]